MTSGREKKTFAENRSDLKFVYLIAIWLSILLYEVPFIAILKEIQQEKSLSFSNCLSPLCIITKTYPSFSCFKIFRPKTEPGRHRTQSLADIKSINSFLECVLCFINIYGFSLFQLFSFTTKRAKTYFVFASKNN